MESDVRKAFESTVSERIINQVPDMPDHVFSKQFEKKMHRLIKYGEIAVPRKITLKKMFIYITAAVIAACAASLSVSAIRETVINFIMQKFDTHTDVRAVQKSDAPLDFTDKYEITADLTDFELVSFTEDIFDRNYIYKKEHCKIYFTQSIKEYYDVAVNTEGYEMETVYINGFEGYYIDMYNQNGKIVTWDNGDYILSILVSCDDRYIFSKDELISLSTSVQKVE
jgi:hypothetical protein